MDYQQILKDIYFRALSAFLRYLSLYFRLAFSGGTNRTVLLSNRKGTSPLSLSS